MPGFDEILNLVRDGEPVAAGVVNRPISETDGNVRYLWELIKASAIGSTIFARQVTVEAGANVGMPVYFNGQTQRFERAIVSVDTADGLLTAGESSRVWGVVYAKINATLADVLLYGFAALDITAALEAGVTLTPGTYYLSNLSAGKLTKLKPPAAIPVLRTTGDGRVFVAPQWEDLLYAHSHLHFPLKAVPAGDHSPPATNARHVITSPNPHVEGWLPANHARFNGLAPHDAKYGYTLWNNPALLKAWPPLPASEARLEMNGAAVPSGTQGLVIFDRNGIWWMSDCYNDVPFPTGIDTEYLTVSESADVSETPLDCPYDHRMRLDLYFSQFAFMTDATVVTSCVSVDNRLVIECEGAPGRAASIGPLQFKLKLEFLFDNTDPGGFLGVKSFDPATQTFHFGPIATGAFAQSGAVTLTSDNQTTEVIGGVARTIHHGRIGVDVSVALNREVYPDLVRLDGAVETFFQDVMCLGLPAGELTQFRARLHVPENLDVVNPKLQLKFRIMGRGIGGLPALTITGRRLPKYTGTPIVLPSSDSAVTITTTGTLTVANSYIDVISTGFTIAAGDDYLFYVTRSASDGYAYEVDILRMVGLIVAS